MPGRFAPDADADPLDLFKTWFAEAEAAGVPDANAMAVATVGADGTPSVRTVLLKELDARGFVFYTNYTSQKGIEIAANPRAALLFHWQPLHRQIRITGAVTRTSREESAAYFNSRPLGSRVSAAISRQSQPVDSRETLERRAAELAACVADGVVPLPEEWGGYRVSPEIIELWQGRDDRLHDRARFTRLADGGWRFEILQP
ncbi:MAG: pyridoxamine 5'-phosphate oxidase [Chloroflexota bacterium]